MTSILHQAMQIARDLPTKQSQERLSLLGYVLAGARTWLVEWSVPVPPWRPGTWIDVVAEPGESVFDAADRAFGAIPHSVDLGKAYVGGIRPEGAIGSVRPRHLRTPYMVYDLNYVREKLRAWF